jgi:hypothetical protein
MINTLLDTTQYCDRKCIGLRILAVHHIRYPGSGSPECYPGYRFVRSIALDIDSNHLPSHAQGIESPTLTMPYTREHDAERFC